ncbi:MAG: hypothetical protein H6739_28025 [Alphaproteobacteria bacterium]|nr:hypothetical protein [Alphaproteobacteria bacterium]
MATTPAQALPASEAFQAANPLHISLYDADEDEVLPILDPDGAEPLTLELVNTSARGLALEGLTAASAEAHHLELRFRPGVVDETVIDALAVSPATWRSAVVAQADGGVSLFLASAQALALSPEQRLTLRIDGLSASGEGGARSTRVRYSYDGLRYQGDDAAFSGVRHQHLSILSRQGRRSIPLHLAAEGGGQILNDGSTASTVALHLANTQAVGEPGLRFVAGSGEENEGASRLVLHFGFAGGDEDHALADDNQIKALKPTIAGWTVTPPADDAAALEWVFTPDADVLLAPRQTLVLTIPDIRTTKPAGAVDVHLRYEGVPGYWDGDLSATVLKTPLYAAGQQVGLGTTTPRSAFDTGKGTMTGAAQDYATAQYTMSGGGAITWGGTDGRLKWTQRILAIGMGKGGTFADGYVQVDMPTSDLPADRVWDRTPRSVTADGVLIKQWEALYAEHQPGTGRDSKLYLARYTEAVTVPSNWVLVAVCNRDTHTLKLGSGQLLTKGDTLDTATGMVTGAMVDYPRAQVMMSGGGEVSWAGKGGRLRWSERFIAIGMGKGGSFGYGHVDIKQPKSDIAGDAALGTKTISANDSGVVLGAWDALYAEHTPGGVNTAVTFHLIYYKAMLKVPANWILVAVCNGDDNTVRLGTGQILRAGESTSNRQVNGQLSFGARKEATIQRGVSFNANVRCRTYNDSRWNTSLTWTEGMRIVTPLIGVLATTKMDVLMWTDAGGKPEVFIPGVLKAESKYFSIPHPTQAGAELVHACLEGPENAVYYRGEARLVDGEATVTLPAYFEALTRPEGRTVQLTAKGRVPFLLSYEDIEDGRFTVYGTVPDGVFSWEVRAVRADVERLVVERGGDAGPA